MCCTAKSGWCVASTQADGSIEAGIQIKLDPGWKTYWRVPGDAGVPPEFDWARSVNVADVAVSWPTPIRFRDQFGESIGYKTEVVFPVRVFPVDWTKKTSVKLTVHYAVCNDICAPVRAELSLDLAAQSSSSRFAGLIARYKTLVPKPVDEVEGLRIDALSVEPNGADFELVVDVKSDDASSPIDMFVEGADKFYFATPREVAAETAGIKRYRIRVDGVPDRKALSGERLEFVLACNEKRVAQSWLLQ